jgi:hypothetical protein
VVSNFGLLTCVSVSTSCIQFTPFSSCTTTAAWPLWTPRHAPSWCFGCFCSGKTWATTRRTAASTNSTRGGSATECTTGTGRLGSRVSWFGVQKFASVDLLKLPWIRQGFAVFYCIYIFASFFFFSHFFFLKKSQRRRLQPRNGVAARRAAATVRVAVLLAPGPPGVASQGIFSPRTAQHPLHVLDSHRPGIYE